MHTEPTLGEPPNERLLQTYHGYPEAERRILQVLSVVYQPVNQTTLKAVLRRLAWRAPDGTRLANIMGKPLRARALADGLVSHDKNLLRCHPDIVEVLSREALAAGRFEEVARVAEQVIPDLAVLQGTVRTRDAAWTYLVRRALYAGGDTSALRQLGLDGWSYRDRWGAPITDLVRVCTRPFDRAWFEGLPPNIHFQILSFLLDEGVQTLGGSADAWRLMEDYFAAAPPNREVALYLVDQYLYRGDVQHAEALLAGDGSTAGLSRLGWMRFLQGRYADSLQSFEAAVEAQKWGKRKGRPHLSGLPGIFHALALARSPDPAQQGRARGQLVAAFSVFGDDPFRPVGRLLEDLLKVRAGEMEGDESVWLQRDTVGLEPWLHLFRCLALHWLGATSRPRQMATLLRYCKAAEAAGLWWYAREAALLLAEVGKEEACAEALAQEGPATEHRAITALFRPEARWERALRALKSVTADEAEGPRKTPSDLRMAWRLSCDRGGCFLEPREQRRGKAGGWTGGRAVSLERLHRDLDDFPYLSAQDRRICEQIAAHTVYEHFGRYPKTVYRLDYEQALSAAVGHPLLFRADDPERPVELTEGEPVLEVRHQEERLRLELRPFPVADHDLAVEHEGRQRLRLVRFNEQHHRIAEILGEQGLDVPQEARGEVLESVAAIAPLLSIHSDIEDDAGSEASAVDADARPHIQLRPAGEGLAIECYVRPFGERGPLFRPGEGRRTLLTEVDGEALRTTREIDAEQAGASRVLDACRQLSPDAEWSWVLEDAEPALSTLLQLQEMGDEVRLEWPQGEKVRLTRAVDRTQMQVAVHKQRDWFGLEGELRVGDERVVSMQGVLELLSQSPGRFVRLGEGEFVTLTQELHRRLEALRAVTDQGRFHPLASPVIEEITEGMEVQAHKAWRDRVAQLREAQDLRPEPPSTLQAELRDYQLDGYRWLARLAHWGAGACLADDMGLGKTVQALALILGRAPEGPTLVLAPSSVCTNWLEEAARFAPTLKARRFGPGDREEMLAQAGPFDLIVCSYGLLQSESERLAAVTWSTLVADEAQALKNRATKRFKASVALQAGFRLITTGTPIENHLGELWALFRFINPGLLGPLERFNRRFAAPIEQHRDRAARERLRQLIRPFILRRLKSEVLTELPPRTEITLHVELSEEETVLYEAMRRRALDTIQDESVPAAQLRFRILTEMTRLRRACCHPRLVLPDSPVGSAKLQAFIEVLEELRENGHKALVFSQFVGHLALIREHLDGAGVRYQYLDGSTPTAQRAAAVNAFQAGEGDLFLISLRAGGSGLNLTAADYVIHMDPWWNPAVEDQASDRAYRIGQRRPVTVYRLVARDTIEEKIVALHAHKRDLADHLLEGNDLSGQMSVDEMLDLFREEGEIGEAMAS